MATIYENFRAACKRHGTTLTEVLVATGHSSGSTGTWKQGRPPKLDIVIDIANYLHVSLDELVFGEDRADEIVREKMPSLDLTDEQKEWLDVLSHIPEEKHSLCLDFLKTHMAEPDKYAEGKMA